MDLSGQAKLSQIERIKKSILLCKPKLNNSIILRDSRININASNECTPIQLAVYLDEPALVSCLLDNDAALHSSNSVLLLAVFHKKKIAFRVLVQYCIARLTTDETGYYQELLTTAALAAAGEGATDMLEIMFHAGVDLKKCISTELSSVDGTKMYLKGNFSAMNIAVLKNKLNVIQWLDAHGFHVADHDTKQLPPLVCAFMHKDTAIIQYLINHGADPAATHEDMPIIIAALQFKHMAGLQILLKTGKIDLNQKPGGKSILSWCAYYGYREGIDLLLKAGAVLDCDINGTPNAIIEAASQRRLLALMHLLAIQSGTSSPVLSEKSLRINMAAELLMELIAAHTPLSRLSDLLSLLPSSDYFHPAVLNCFTVFKDIAASNPAFNKWANAIRITETLQALSDLDDIFQAHIANADGEINFLTLSSKLTKALDKHGDLLNWYHDNQTMLAVEKTRRAACESSTEIEKYVQATETLLLCRIAHIKESIEKEQAQKALLAPIPSNHEKNTASFEAIISMASLDNYFIALLKLIKGIPFANNVHVGLLELLNNKKELIIDRFRSFLSDATNYAFMEADKSAQQDSKLIKQAQRLQEKRSRQEAARMQQEQALQRRAELEQQKLQKQAEEEQRRQEDASQKAATLDMQKQEEEKKLAEEKKRKQERKEKRIAAKQHAKQIAALQAAVLAGIQPAKTITLPAGLKKGFDLLNSVHICFAVGSAVIAALTNLPANPGNDYDFTGRLAAADALLKQGFNKSKHVERLFTQYLPALENNQAESFDFFEMKPEQLHKDAHERDLTICAIYLDAKGRVYDPTGRGLRDLESMTLHMIGNDPLKRLREDLNRLLHIMKYISLGFKPDADLEAALKTVINEFDTNNLPNKLVFMKKHGKYHEHYRDKYLAALSSYHLLEKLSPDKKNGHAANPYGLFAAAPQEKTTNTDTKEARDKYMQVTGLK